MARLRTFEFESGEDATDITLVGGGNPSYDTSKYFTGSRSLLCDGSYPSGLSQVNWYHGRTSASGTTYYARIYFWVDSTHTFGVNQTLLGIADNSTSYRHYVRMDNSFGTTPGILRLYSSQTGSIGTTSTAISTGTWHYLELAWKRNSNNNDYVEARLDGTSFASTTTTTLGNGNEITRIYTGNGYDVGTSTDDVWIDAYALNDDTGSTANSWPGGWGPTIAPPVGSITFAGLASAVSVSPTVVPTVASITFTGLAPTVHLSPAQDPSNVPTITFTGLSPTLHLDGSITPSNVPTITFTGLDCIATLGVPVGNTPTITFAGLEPTVSLVVSVEVTNTSTITFAAPEPTAQLHRTVAVTNTPTVTFTALDPTIHIPIGIHTAYITDSPTVYYRMHDTSGAAMTAEVGTNGTYFGSVALSQAGIPGGFGDYAVKFAGNVDNGCFAVPSWSTLQLTTSATIEMWVKNPHPTTGNVGGTLYTERYTAESGASHSFDILVSTASLASVTMRSLNFFGSGSGSNLDHSVVFGVNLNDGEWHQIVATKSSSTYTFYVDGVAVGSYAHTATSPSETYTKRLAGGPGNFPLTTCSPTYMDEVGYWSTALSGTQLANHYAAGGFLHENVSVEATNTPSVAFAGPDPTIIAGVPVTVTVTNTPFATFAALAPNLFLNGGPVAFVDPVTVVFAAFAPTIHLMNSVLIQSQPATCVFSAHAATIFLGDITFAFIPDTYTGFTARDADVLASLDFGAMLHGQSKIGRFRLGNSSSSNVTLTVTALSVNNLAEMVSFSFDNTTYSGAVVLTVEPNAVSDVIWVRLDVDDDAYISPGTFLINVEQS